jgi:bifunctional UDP-N-acetylglucosamine pyrophosphorylase/glucosamine-1-phosphate N-acetyltransferase
MESIILAGGRGSRMKEVVPKVLVDVEGEPMLQRIVSACRNKYIDQTIVVVGSNGGLIQNVLKNEVKYAYQMVPLGTLDAFVQGLPLVSSSDVLVLPGDIPCINKEVIEDIIEYYKQNHCRNLVIGMRVSNPVNYGRMVKSERGKTKIIEEKNATQEQLNNMIINTGIYILRVEDVYPYLSISNKDSITNEYYLTDYINYLAENNKLSTLIYPETYVLKGANDMVTLRNILKQKNKLN